MAKQFSFVRKRAQIELFAILAFQCPNTTNLAMNKKARPFTYLVEYHAT